MNIVIADDHTLVLEGLELLLSTFSFVDNIHKANSYARLKNVLESELCDILILDIAFGADDGVLVCKELKQQYPQLRIIALTSHSEIATIQRAMRVGFDSYLLKSEDREIIEKALITVNDGESYFSPTMQELFLKQSLSSQSSSTLTKRELEVLQLIVSEKSSREIAELLFLSEKTVENHRSNIMLKLDAKNLAGLVKKALIQGLAE